jgi:hypothetical protein
MAAKTILFEDRLQVTEVDPDGKRFDKGTAPPTPRPGLQRATATCAPFCPWLLPDTWLRLATPVSRLRCRGENTDAECTLDVNVDIFPLKATDKVFFALSSTLSDDGKPDDGSFEQARPFAPCCCCSDLTA